MTDDEKLVLRQEIVTRARACVGTPWHHQARLPGVGMDCVGLVVHAFKDIVDIIDRVAYSRIGNAGMLMDHILAIGCVEVSKEELELADVVFFRIGGRMQHACIISGKAPLMMVHVPVMGAGVCEERELSRYLFDTIHSCWRLGSLR